MKKVRLFIMAFAVIALFFILPQPAKAETSGIWTYYTNPSSKAPGGYEVSIYGCSGSGAITVPSTIGGYYVVSVSSFYNNESITSVTFSSNSYLRSFGGFHGCTNLRSVNMSGITLEKLDDSFFYCCWALSSISWPQGVKKIGKDAFCGCDSLTSLTIPSTVTSIEGTTSVGYGTFGCCDALKSIDFSKCQITKLPDQALYKCTALTSVKLPSTLRTIGIRAFYQCSALESVALPDGVQYIEEGAFEDCKAMKSITLPDSVRTIEERAFDDCDEVTAIHLPKNVYSVTALAFNNMSKLSTITVDANNNYYCVKDGVLFNKSMTELVCYPFAKRDTTSYYVPDGVTTIGEKAFLTPYNSSNIYYGYPPLTDIYFPPSLTTVREYGMAFIRGNLYFCGAKPTFEDYSSGSTNVKLYYTPGQAGWEGTGRAYEWPNEQHCTVEGPAFDPTCGAAGGHMNSCPRCGYVGAVYNGAPATNAHTYGDWQLVTENTCETDGKKTRECSSCHAVDTQILPAWGHSMGGVPTESLEPDCTNAVVCDRCQTVVKPALGHRIIVETNVEVDPLVVENTSSTPFSVINGTYCSNNHANSSQSDLRIVAQCACTLTLRYGVSSESNYDKLIILYNGTQQTAISGEVSNRSMVLDLAAGDVVIVRYSKDYSASNGSDQGWVALEYDFVGGGDVTASTDGFEPDCYHAVVCDYCQTVVKEKLEHGYELIDEVLPTCTETGLTDGVKCPACSFVHVEQEIVPALGHDTVIDEAVAPTCTETGLTEGSHCERCGEVLAEQESVPVLGHNTVIDEAVAATCTETGLTEGSHCDRCQDVFVAQRMVSALGHDTVTDEAVAPTCTETGLTEGSHCGRCEEVFTAQAVVPALGHDTVTDEAVAATCTETGLTEGSHCGRCEEVFVAQETVPELGHDTVIDEAVAPTCTETGLTEGSHCERCKVVFVAQKTVQKNSHSVVIDQPVEPTCTESGLAGKGMHCGVCGEVIKLQTVVPAFGHTYTEATFTWAEDLGSAAATSVCHCGYVETVDCKLVWDHNGRNELTVTASAIFGENTFEESKKITSSVEDGSITIALPNEIPGLKVVAAVYNEKGQMTECKIPDVSGCTVTFDFTGYKICVFFLMDDHHPVAPAMVI